MKILIVDFDGMLDVQLRYELKEYSDRVSIGAASDKERALGLIRNCNPDLTIVEYKSLYADEIRPIFQKLKRANLEFIVIAKLDKTGIYEDIFEFNPRSFFCAPIDFMSLKYQIDRLLIDRKTLRSKTSNSSKDYFVFKWNSQLRKEKFCDIDYIYAEGNYITLHMDDREYLVRYSLRTIEGELPHRNFVRIHRNYIVNLSGVKSIDIGKNLVILPNVELPIGRKYKRDVKAAFSNLDYSHQLDFDQVFI